MVECQRWGHVAAVLLWPELAAVDGVVTHAPANSCADQAAKNAGWTAAMAGAELTKRTRFRKDVADDAALRFVAFAVETYMGNKAVRFVNRLGDIDRENGHIPRGASVQGNVATVGVGAEGQF